MKKTFVLIAIAALALAACTKEEPGKDAAPVKTILSIGADPTKTTIGDLSEGHRPMYWADGDQVRANGVISNALENVPAGSARMDFSFTESVSAPYNTVYPASIYKDANTVTLPHNAGDQVIPLGGVSQTTSMTLSPLTGVLQLKIKQPATDPDTDNIVLIEVSTASTRMSGDFSIEYSTGELTAAASPSGNDLAVQITGDWALSSTETSFFIPVPAGSYDFTVKVMDKKGHYMTKSTTTPKTFVQGIIQPLKAFEFVPSASDGIEIDTPEKLIAFAQAYNDGDYKDLGKDLVATVTADLVFDANTSAAFNATGGIGNVGPGGLFNGVFDGGNHSIGGLAATVPLFKRVGANGTVKNLTLAASSSFTYSSAVTNGDDSYMGSFVGYNKGDLQDCVNYAPVSCASTSFSVPLFIGGLVGSQYKSGTISGCTNYAAVTCSASGPAVSAPATDAESYSNAIHMGGLVGCVQRIAAGDNASISDSRNEGAVNANFTVSVMSHVAGAIGWVYGETAADKMTITGLTNVGNVYLANRATRNDYTAALVAGLIGGIHGAQVANASCKVEVKNSSVSNCSVSNGGFSNATGYGTNCHTGGFVGVVRGNSAGDITFSDNCFVKNVSLETRRGTGGGFVSCATSASFTGCNVLASSLKGSRAQLRLGGGMVGFLRSDCTLTDCIVTLTKDATYSLYGLCDTNTEVNVGGLVGNNSGTNTITRCRAYVSLMYVGTNKTEAHGWLIGKNTGTLTLTDCGLGGTYGQTTATLTLDSTNYADYVCGSAGTLSQSGTYYWDGSDAPGSKVVSIVIADYAAAHGWTNGGSESPQTIEQDGVTLTASASAGNTNGNYNTQWRFYQARGGGLTVSVPSGKTLISATFTYTVTNTGVLIAPNGTTQVESGTAYLFPANSGNSAFFTVGNTDSSVTNGQCRFTKIVVEYE